MIINQSEVSKLERLLRKGGQGMNMRERENVCSYLCRNPHLLLPAGFDDCRVFNLTDSLKSMPVEELFPQERTRIQGKPFFFGYEAIFRHKQTGKWFLLWFLKEDYSVMLLGKEQEELLIPPSELLSCLRKANKKPLQQHSSIILPELWTHASLNTQQVLLNEVNRDLLRALHQEKIKLTDVDWRQLEIIVAELLDSKGLNVRLTKKTRDGGRDILVEGEFIPGIQSLMAVEVKHKTSVGIGDFAQFMYRNKEFPLLMLATSGRFSSGVLKESEKELNQLRLILRDGTALQDWINEYARYHNW